MKDTGTDERITTIDLILVQLDKWGAAIVGAKENIC